MNDAQGASPETTAGAAGITRVERQPLVLPPIFNNMPSYRMSREVRALKIETATHEGDKIKLTFAGGYFPAIDVESWLSAPIEGEAVFMVDNTGEHHIVPADEFNQHFKLNT
jgi:hypothetical protein